MITLCIDVGLRNLSMCIMNNNYSILLWDIFNILDSDDHLCTSSFKNGKLCNRKCTKTYIPLTENKNPVFCCKTHFPKDIKAAKMHDFKKKSIDAYLLQDIAKAFIQRVQDIYDHNQPMKQVNTVLIELQPKCNPKMLFTSHILYGKLVELYKETNITVKFVRASQKLKAYTGPIIECPLKGKYAQRKWLSVKYGYWFLENKFSKEQQELWLPTLTGKLDDRMDCFLMAINSITGVPKKQLKHKNGNELK